MPLLPHLAKTESVRIKQAAITFHFILSCLDNCMFPH